MQVPIRAFVVYIFVTAIVISGIPLTYTDPTDATVYLLIALAKSGAITSSIFLLVRPIRGVWDRLHPGHTLGLLIAYPTLLSSLAKGIPIPHFHLLMFGLPVVLFAKQKPGASWKLVIIVHVLVMIQILGEDFRLHLPRPALSIILLANVAILAWSMSCDVRRSTTRDWMHWIGSGSFMLWWCAMVASIWV